MRVFDQNDINDLFDQIRRQLKSEIQELGQDAVFGVSEQQLIDSLVQKYEIEELQIDFDQTDATRQEATVNYGSEYDYGRGGSRRSLVFTYHIPITGNQDLLKYRPTTSLLWSEDMQVVDNELLFKVSLERDDAGQVNKDTKRIFSNLKQQNLSLRSDITRFNQQLRVDVATALQSRKQRLAVYQEAVKALKVPIRKVEKISDVFVAPIKKKTVALRPSSPSAQDPRQWVLSDEIYEEILRILFEAGREFERHPVLYEGRSEETLRDSFLVVLTPHFQSASGETFNRKGKTDILIRHDGANVFVAECKFWKGSKVHKEAIDQLLSYLTWRDGKAALLCFVENKQMELVLEAISKETSAHSCFIRRLIGKRTIGRLDFQFHLPGNSSAVLRLAVLCFHFPKVG